MVPYLATLGALFAQAVVGPLLRGSGGLRWRNLSPTVGELAESVQAYIFNEAKVGALS
jgi:hypothetical protein